MNKTKKPMLDIIYDGSVIGIINYEIKHGELYIYNFNSFGEKNVHLNDLVRLIDCSISTVYFYQDRRFVDLKYIKQEKMVYNECIDPQCWFLSNNYLKRTIKNKNIFTPKIYDVGIIKFKKEIK
jgi:hypothetical protein